MSLKKERQEKLIKKYGEHALVRCWLCGLHCPGILQIAHLNHNNKDDRPTNLACLCPTCHRLYDVDMIPRKLILTAGRQVRDGIRKFRVSTFWKEISNLTKNGKKPNWKVLMGLEDPKWVRIAKKAVKSRN